MVSIGKSLPHDSAHGHVTGSAAYIDDLTPLADDLFVDFVGAPIAAGLLRSIDASIALGMEGVVAVLTHRDLPGTKRLFGPIFHDEPFLVEEEISYIGQPIVVVVATSRKAAHAAVRAIKLSCEATTPILTIDDAIRLGSYLGPRRKIERGDVMAALVAISTKRSARVIYGKDQDMISTGKRHPYQTKYRAAFDDDVNSESTPSKYCS